MPRRSPLLHQTNASYLSFLFSYGCAPFGATEPSQPLPHQSLPHSFPCNGGGRVSSLVRSLLTRSSPLHAFFYFQSLLPRASRGTNCSKFSPLAASLCFQRLTHCPICKPFALITLQQYPGVCTPQAMPTSSITLIRCLPPTSCPAKPDLAANVTHSGSTALASTRTAPRAVAYWSQPRTRPRSEDT